MEDLKLGSLALNVHMLILFATLIVLDMETREDHLITPKKVLFYQMIQLMLIFPIYF